MATNETLIEIPSRLHNAADGGHVAGADQIFDDDYGTNGTLQSQINAAHKQALEAVVDIPIPFKSDAVREILAEAHGGVSGGDTGIPGYRNEVTFRQAFAVTQLVSFYAKGLQDATFDELKYFKNAVIITGCFRESGITSLCFPENILPNNVLNGGVVRKIQGFVELPPTLVEILTYNFWQSTGDLIVKLHATSPPTIDYSKNNSVTKIYVPAASLTAYQQDAEWGQFGNKLEGF